MADRGEATSVSLTGDLLRSVSRSFYLSIRLLPAGLRDPVGLAYLLARATDTLADTSGVSVSTRREKLKALSQAIATADQVGLQDLANDFAPRQTNESERRLIFLVPECLSRLRQCDSPDRADIQTVLAKITRAQEFDLERFGDGGAVRALQNAAELDEYTYLIAGCVGEFWTDMCNRHLRAFTSADVEEMRKWGRAYGKGLQLVNILRDLPNDLAAGRCYLPQDELMQAGILPAEVLERPDVAIQVVWAWLQKAEDGIRSGMRYVEATNNRRVRVATALPALIGIRTIEELRTAGVGIFERRVKIPRAQVRSILFRAVAGLGSRKVLQGIFAAR